MKNCGRSLSTGPMVAAVALLTGIPLSISLAAPDAAATGAAGQQDSVRAAASSTVRSAVHRPGGRRTVRLSEGMAGAEADGSSTELAISGTGRRVAFTSDATNLVPGDTNGVADVFVVDRPTGAIRRVSVTSAGGQVGGSVSEPAISANGRYVAFTSTSPDLVPGDTNALSDVFVHDLRRGTTRRVSLGAGNAQAAGFSATPSLSADGRYVAFTSWAPDLVPADTNQVGDVFVRDLRRGTTVRASVASDGTQSNDVRYSYEPQISAGGRYVVFTSFATNLVPADTNFGSDIFVHDLRTGATVRASIGSDGSQSTGGLKGFINIRPSISADGRVVAFDSTGDGLLAEPPRHRTDSYVHDLRTGLTQRVALGPGGVVGNSGGANPAVSADGRYVAFESYADNLVPGDTNVAYDVFVRDLRKQVTTRVSVGAGGQADSYSTTSAISAHGRHVGFLSGATNLVAGDDNGLTDVFLR
jgi:Tol biopolymer transport system component